MSTIRLQHALMARAFIIALAALPMSTLATTPPPDAGLYTSYSIGSGYTNVTWTVCGTTQTTEGCYGSGTLGPFGHAGAMIESSPVVDFATGTVIRYIYIVDNAATPRYNTEVVLNVYKKVDVVTSSTDTVTVSLVKAVKLGIVGGAGTSAYMAANANYIYVGTSAFPFAVRIQRTNLSHLVNTAQATPSIGNSNALFGHSAG